MPQNLNLKYKGLSFNKLKKILKEEKLNKDEEYYIRTLMKAKIIKHQTQLNKIIDNLVIEFDVEDEEIKKEQPVGIKKDELNACMANRMLNDSLLRNNFKETTMKIESPYDNTRPIKELGENKIIIKY